MQLYVTNSNDDILNLLDKYNICEDIKLADFVLILPGGLGTFKDLFNAIDMNKKVIIYNKDLYYSSLFKNLFEGYEKGYINVAPSKYLCIESELENIIKILEDKKI